MRTKNIHLLSGVNHGHTGHVRFLTSVELGPENGGGGRGPPTAATARPAASTAGSDARLPIRKDNSPGTAKNSFSGLNLFLTFKNVI